MLASSKNQSILVFLFFPDLAKMEFHQIGNALDCVVSRSVAAHCLVVMRVMALSHEYAFQMISQVGGHSVVVEQRVIYIK